MEKIGKINFKKNIKKGLTNHYVFNKLLVTDARCIFKKVFVNNKKLKTNKKEGKQK